MNLRPLALFLTGTATVLAQAQTLPVPVISAKIQFPNGVHLNLPVQAFQLNEGLAPANTSILTTALTLQLKAGLLSEALVWPLQYAWSNNPATLTLTVAYNKNSATPTITTITASGLALGSSDLGFDDTLPTFSATTSTTPSFTSTGSQLFGNSNFDISFYDPDNGNQKATPAFFQDYLDFQGARLSNFNPIAVLSHITNEFDRPWLGDTRLPAILQAELNDNNDFHPTVLTKPSPNGPISIGPPVVVQFSTGLYPGSNSNHNPPSAAGSDGLPDPYGWSYGTMDRLVINVTDHGSDQETVTTELLNLLF